MTAHGIVGPCRVFKLLLLGSLGLAAPEGLGQGHYISEARSTQNDTNPYCAGTAAAPPLLVTASTCDATSSLGLTARRNPVKS